MNDLELILVHNHKGGTGKTFLTVHLAFYLARHGQPWTVWDMDPQHNTMTWLTGHTWEGEEGLVIPGENGAADLVATTEWSYTNGPSHLLVDTPPSVTVLDEFQRRATVNERDIVICPVSTRHSIDGAIKVAEEMVPTGCRVVLVPNLVEVREWHTREAIRAVEELAEASEVNVEVFRMAIPMNTKYVGRAELEGVPVWDLPHAGRTHVAKALQAFGAWIADGAPPEANRPGAMEEDGPSYDVSRKLQKRLWNRS
jgi:CO dehydrogenase nickel-insertion accessory protein CooC1